jgi:hypothetical protein
MSESANAHLDKILGLSQRLESLGHSAAFERVIDNKVIADDKSLRIDPVKIPVELIPGWIRDMHDLAPRFALDNFQANLLRDVTSKLRPGTWTVSANYTLNEMPYLFRANGKVSKIDRQDSAGNKIEHTFGSAGHVTQFLGSVARGLINTKYHTISSPELLLDIPRPEDDDYKKLDELFIAIAGLSGRYQSTRKAFLFDQGASSAIFVKQLEGVTPNFKETKMMYHDLSLNEYSPSCTLVSITHTQRSVGKENVWTQRFATERELPIVALEDLPLELDLGLLDDPESFMKAKTFKPDNDSFDYEFRNAVVMEKLQPFLADLEYLDGKNQTYIDPEEVLNYIPPELA